MAGFYDQWLGFWDEAERQRSTARWVINPDELEWVETTHDARAALLVAPETGFRTWGGAIGIAEIPVGWQTGKARQGEVVMHIVSGSGCSIIDDVRYDWEAGATLVVPFGSTHKHLNTGDSPVTYVFSVSVHIEQFAGICKIEQIEACGPTSSLPDVPASADGYAPDGYRIALALAEAPRAVAENRHKEVPVPEIDPDNPLVLGETAEMGKRYSAQHEEVIQLMRIGTDLNDFKVHLSEISGIFVDPPNAYGGKHAHMEATLYVLEGHGYSIVDGQRVEWTAGSAIHVPGPQTVHQHFFESDTPVRMLRLANGLRYFLEPSAKNVFPYLYHSPRKGYESVGAPSGP